MLKAALAFFVLGVLALVFGAYNVAGISLEAGRAMLGAFLILVAISLLLALLTGRTPRQLR